MADSQGRQRAERAVLLLPGVVLAVAYFEQDYASALTGPALLVDALCLILVIVIVVGTVGVVLAPPILAARMGVAASAATSLLALAVLMTAFSPQQNETVVVAGAALALVAALVNLYMLNATAAWFRASLGKSAAATATLIAIPVFSFWQATAYLPSQSEVSLTTTINATAIVATDGTEHWQIRGTSKNPSTVRAYTVVSDLVACSWKDERTRAESSTDTRENPDCIKLNRPIGTGWIDAGSQLDFSDSVPVMADKKFLSLHFRVAYGRGDRLRDRPGSERETTAREEGTCFGARVSELQEQSRLRSLVLQPKFLMFADADGDGGLNYFVAPRNDLVCPVRPDSDLARYYSITEARVIWTEWLTEPADPPAGS